MDFTQIPSSAYPAYTWVWNTTITKEGIRAQLDEMYERGIRAVYVLGEGQCFRPNRCRTDLHPDYMTPEYVELVHYAYLYAKEKGIYTWLYNEGGYPSGMVCGQIIADRPELATMGLSEKKRDLAPGEHYTPAPQALSAFIGRARIREGYTATEAVTITEYIPVRQGGIRTDIARRENAEEFLTRTHAVWKKQFGDAMGTDVTLMFDDEASMDPWTEGLERIFYTRYGYDIADYAYLINKKITPETEAEQRAFSDYLMLCGELVRENYFIPMRDWLREHGMKSTGHLNKDNETNCGVYCRYGNTMETLRTFDVPGIDVIWSQITFPENGKACFEGNEYFPRIASSAARQLGHSTAMSETFAVFGAQVTPEEMRYAVNYQAVRGISLFNFMVVSYDRQSAMCHQYRPNFIRENPGMDCLTEINNYTARISYILQNSRSNGKTALYTPYRTISAGGNLMNRAVDATDALGEYLEKAGVDFDIIDEAFVESATLDGTALVGEHIRYDWVFVPEVCDLEKPEVLDRLAQTTAEVHPSFLRENPALLCRHLIFDGHREAFFIVNTANEDIMETVTLPTGRSVQEMDLQTGECWRVNWDRTDEGICVPVSLLRGQGILFVASDARTMVPTRPQWEEIMTLAMADGYVSRHYTLHPQNGIINTYYDAVTGAPMGTVWDAHFSGEVTYEATLPRVVGRGPLMLELDDVRHFAKVYLNGEKVAELTMPPYRCILPDHLSGKLTVVIANTIAPLTHDAEFFTVQDIRDVGPYHANMKLREVKVAPGGWSGQIRVYRERLPF